MKTIKSLFATATLLLCSMVANAHDFEMDGIYYNILSEENLIVEVTRPSAIETKYSGTVTIPESVTYNEKVYSVTTIGKQAFFFCSGLTSVSIPNSVTAIGENAFWVAPALQA